MKRLFLFFLLFMLACGFAFANGDQESTKKDSTSTAKERKINLKGRKLRLVAWWDPKETNQVRLAKIAQLEKKYNFKLVYVNSGDWQGHHDNLVSSVAAGSPIGEFVWIDQTFFAGLVKGNIIQPVDGHGIDFSAPYYHQIKRAFFSLNGHEYGIKETYIEPGAAVWFNKSLLEREGIENIYELQKNGKWTWDKMLEIAKKVTKDLNGDGTIDQWGFAHDTLHVLALGLLASNNANVVEKGKVVLDSPQALEALQFYQDLNVKHKVMAMLPDGADWNWAYGKFGEGKIAFLPMWYWGNGYFGKPVDSLCWALMPAGPKGKMTSIAVGSSTVIIPTGVKDIDDLLYVWDKINAPDPDFLDPNDDPYGWIYNYFSDVESVEVTQHMISEKGLYTIFTHEIYGLRDIWQNFPGTILTGEKSPGASVEEIKPVMESKIVEVIGQ